jgi:cytochrome o ubiquinol oxidase subunit 2
VRVIRIAALTALALLVSGCKAVVLHPAGDVAMQQRDLLVESTALMLVIIVPVMLLTVVFAWRYRQGNKAARYEPDWDHSTQLELVIWGAPLLIIICLGALTWMGTHLLDPYRGLDRLGAGRAVASDTTPLEVDAVALDWKWLFIYPQYGVAAVNEMAAPVDRPISFRITASSVMNSFYIPALAGQIYAMPGMETKLHAVINKAGTYEGFSANYSGAGFSDMHFAFHGVDTAGFKTWVDGIKGAGGSLSRAAYLDLARPSENVPVRTYAAVDGGLYNAIVNMCVRPGTMCVSQMMAIDAKGGLGLAGTRNVRQPEHNQDAARGTVLGAMPTAVVGACATGAGSDMQAATPPASPVRISPPLLGAGLTPPSGAPSGGRESDLHATDHKSNS